VDAEDWDRRYAEQDLLWSAEPNNFLVEETRDLAPGRALDLAAGEGRNAIWLAEQGWEVTAVDFSPVALDRGRAIAARRGIEVRWVLDDVLAFEPGAETYDLVIVLYLQIPSNEQTAVLTKAARAVATGGTVLVVGHAVENLDGGTGGPQDAALLLRTDVTAACLREAGLDIVKEGLVTRMVDTEEGPREAIDVLVRASRLPAASRRSDRQYSPERKTPLHEAR
jgi:SAM-dependent methyltransferase